MQDGQHSGALAHHAGDGTFGSGRVDLTGEVEERPR
jgi:hypothetical protein